MNWSRKALALIGLLSLATPAHAINDAGKRLIGTFASTIYIASAPGTASAQLLFVVEQAGRVRVLRNETNPTLFLDLHTLVLFGGEQGLSSIAFHPDYANNRRFYLAFTNKAGDLEVDEFRRNLSDPTKADFSSRRIVIIAPHPEGTNHYGGQLQFSPTDGLLYISTGDGGDGVTPIGDKARDITDLRGKILRINPLPSGGKAYSIPSTNPFVGRTGRDEIYSYGLRNPFRFSFDGKRIIIADVGAQRREEVDYLNKDGASGTNFGWPEWEGDLKFSNRPGPDPAVFPMFVYDHNNGRCAVIGGYVGHDGAVPRLLNRYVYGDLCTGQVRSFVGDVANQTANGDRYSGVTLFRIHSFGLGVNQQIYVADGRGRVWRLIAP
jgi:Glucose / Sorbosone dehydrogenase